MIENLKVFLLLGSITKQQVNSFFNVEEICINSGKPQESRMALHNLLSQKTFFGWDCKASFAKLEDQLSLQPVSQNDHNSPEIKR